METAQIADELCGFVRGQLLPPGALEFNATSPLRDFGLDSFALIEILLFCESRFGARIPDSELKTENLRNIASLARCIGAHAGGDQ